MAESRQRVGAIVQGHDYGFEQNKSAMDFVEARCIVPLQPTLMMLPK